MVLLLLVVWWVGDGREGGAMDSYLTLFFLAWLT